MHRHAHTPRSRAQRPLDPENIVVESTFFLQTLPFIIAGKAASIDNLAMRFNTYDPGHALQLVGEFKTCSNFRLDDGFQGARRTTARVSTPMTVSITERGGRGGGGERERGLWRVSRRE